MQVLRVVVGMVDFAYTHSCSGIGWVPAIGNTALCHWIMSVAGSLTLPMYACVVHRTTVLTVYATVVEDRSSEDMYVLAAFYASNQCPVSLTI